MNRMKKNNVVTVITLSNILIIVLFSTGCLNGANQKSPPKEIPSSFHIFLKYDGNGEYTIILPVPLTRDGNIYTELLKNATNPIDENVITTKYGQGIEITNNASNYSFHSDIVMVDYWETFTISNIEYMYSNFVDENVTMEIVFQLLSEDGIGYYANVTLHGIGWEKVQIDKIDRTVP